MSLDCVGTWHLRPTPAFCEGRGDLKKTWTGPVSTELYGKGLTDLCDKTHNNLHRLSQQMQKLDPCLEYGVKHWHPTSRPQSAVSKPESMRKHDRCRSVDVMFTDNKTAVTLGDPATDEQRDTYIDPPVKNTFCYLCTTLEEHKRHMLLHKPKKKYTGRTKIEYIAPRPKQKRVVEEDDKVLLKERLYKIEVFTSDKCNAGTSAKVFVAIKGTLNVLPKTQLKKNQGSSNFCFVRASKEVFHIKGPFLGNLQILSIEHDGTRKSEAWHLEKVLITDVKAMKTWIFHCGEWLSLFEKPHYSNRVDLDAQELEHPPTEYAIEVYTANKKMAGTDSSIFITLFGQYGTSKKILLKDTTSDKKLFEKGSIDKFAFRMNGIGELKKIKIEHDGKGFAAGWYLDKIIIRDSERPKDTYYFMYGGWIAEDEGDGRLWREIPAKKKLPKELHSGTDTKYVISAKTGDIRYAGTDANVFIQMVGEKGKTKQLPIDNPKNNFERNMTDIFEVNAVNVGKLQHIIIGHDNANPGAGWFLEKVTIRRYIPKDEVKERLKKMRKKERNEQKNKQARKARGRGDLDGEDDDVSSSDEESYEKGKRRQSVRHDDEHKYKPDKIDSKKRKDMKHKTDPDKKDKKSKNDKKKDLFSVQSSSSENSSESDSESDRDLKTSKRPGSALRRPGSAASSFRPRSAMRRQQSTINELEESDKNDKKKSKSRRASSASSERDRRDSTSSRRLSTSASGLRQAEEDRRRGRKGHENDDQEDARIPLYEECVFMCNRWLAQDEDDGLFVRELKVSSSETYYKDN
ncbi:lipoxygenase homology domain-containing protein 1-like isoform X2 [Mya arenaria]|uniref:lipoxygenase homology domain-containing protein 1-like isoform X2 n=1 Tax=Mya arenaria TaxID=6604 RepID=UPI0022E6D6BA|nr:lipoxygenase homology domain-containing protein 1-like isoform X2 [Mya arenaria]